MIFGNRSRPPDGISAIGDFKLERYLGKWHEIARLDHSFERGLSNVTAEYSMRNDGRIDVLNRGYDARRSRWRQARAVAGFIGRPDIASLKVTFFWPFWGAYHVIDLDRDNYSRAIVTSSSRSYLWILSREKTLDPAILKELADKIGNWGFRADDLIYVDQQPRT